MKQLSTILIILLISFSSFATNEEKETVKESNSNSFQPKPLNDEWSKWLVGEWNIVSARSDFLGGEELEGVGEPDEQGAGGFKIEPCLNGQFLIWTDQAKGEMTDEQKKQIKEAFKETTNASDEDLDRFVSMPYNSLLIQTIDPTTGERMGYFFDSQRCMATGKSKLEGNKEIMDWKWFLTGRGATSTGIIEKIDDNKFMLIFKYNLPDGKKMEDKIEVVRKKIKTDTDVVDDGKKQKAQSNSDDVSAEEKQKAQTFVIVHGAHDGAWAWRGVAKKLQADGHQVFTTTLTGSGERAHLATPEVDLDTHVQDVVNVLVYEKLNDVILVGHSYGGMVISGAAEKVPKRINQLIYLDAIVPEDGKSCVDIFGPEALAYMEQMAKEYGNGWRLPHNPPNADRRTDALLKAFKQPLSIKNPDAAKLKHTYVRFTKNPMEFAMAKTLKEQGWQYLERPFTHFPVLEKPNDVAQMLIEIVD